MKNIYLIILVLLTGTAHAEIQTGHYKSGWVDGAGKIGDDFFPDRRVDVFVKGITAVTPISKETNYYAFIKVELDKDGLERTAYGSFKYFVNVYRVEEIQPGLLFFYPVKHDVATIKIDYENPVQVRQFIEDGKLKLKFQAEDTNFEAKLENDNIWGSFPIAQKHFFKDDKDDLRYDLLIDKNQIDGTSDIPYILAGQTNKIEKFCSTALLKELFTGMAVAHRFIPNDKTRKGISLENGMYISVVAIHTSKKKVEYFLFSINQAGKLFPAIRVNELK